MTSDQTVYVNVIDLSKFEFLVGTDPTNHQNYSECVDGWDFAWNTEGVKNFAEVAIMKENFFAIVGFREQFFMLLR